MDRYNSTLAAMRQIIVEHFKDAQCRPVGSSYITQSVNNDVDLIVLTPTFGEDEFTACDKINLEFNGSKLDDGTEFLSFKKEIDGVTANFIFVFSATEYDMFGYAADVCRILHEGGVSLDKPLRCDVHSLMRQQMTYEKFKEYKQLQTKGNSNEVVHKRPALLTPEHRPVHQSWQRNVAGFARRVANQFTKLVRPT